MIETNSVVAIYETHTQADEAVKELQRSGFDMKKMSIVGKDYHTDEHVVGYYNTGDRMQYSGKQGSEQHPPEPTPEGALFTRVTACSTGANGALSGVVSGGCCSEPLSSLF